MKTKTLYVAEDGTEFATEEEVMVYEKSLTLANDINAYIEENQIAKPMAGMLRKQLPAFLLWLEVRQTVTAENQ